MANLIGEIFASFVGSALKKQFVDQGMKKENYAVCLVASDLLLGRRFCGFRWFGAAA
jgi:hypothetical protein